MFRQVPLMAQNAQIQPGAPLTSLTEALAEIGRTVEPVAPQERELSAALGYTLAADIGPNPALRLTGARLRRIDIALLASLGIAHVAVRVPRILIVRVASASNAVDATRALIAGAIESEGGKATTTDKPLETTLQLTDVDAVIAIGGGDTRDDASLRTLANMGQIAFDGVSLAPGGGIGLGNIGRLPILLFPGRFEAALVAWLTIGRRLLARLSFRLIEEQPFLLELARPVVSKLGLAEIVPVRRRAAQIEPFANGDWTPQTVARADGWILVPAESDGLPAGSKVAVRPWP